MNKEQPEHVKVMPDKLKNFTASMARKAGMSDERADFLSDLLITNDLRGVFSHGSQQMATYARIMRDGLINANPQASIMNETSTTIVVDGDGGLGYFACMMAVEELVEHCGQNGIAAAVTRNHGHIGAAGIYSRLLAEKGFIGYVTSGHQLELDPDESIIKAAGSSPMSFAIPSDKEVPMVLDFGATLDLDPDAPHFDEIFKMAPGLVFRNIGLGFMCQALGGFLAGVPVVEDKESKRYEGANQGALLIAIDAGRFIQSKQFKQQMDLYMKMTSEMEALPGYDRATLPGVLELEHEEKWKQTGIPVSDEYIEVLEAAAGEFGVKTPF